MIMIAVAVMMVVVMGGDGGDVTANDGIRFVDPVNRRDFLRENGPFPSPNRESPKNEWNADEASNDDNRYHLSLQTTKNHDPQTT